MADERDEDVRDVLPEDLDPSGYVGPYRFPDNSRRRIPGVLYLVVAAGCVALWAATGEGAVLVNDGLLWVGVALAAWGVWNLVTGTRLGTDETEALVAATRAVGFAVGHASAQLGWRGLRSRPTWRILCYSTENPPARRAFVMIDAVDGQVVAYFTEANPEDWSDESG